MRRSLLKSKFQEKMYLIIAVSMFVIILLYASVVYSSVKKNIEKSHQQMVSQTALQLQQKIEYISINAKSLSHSIYYSPDVINLLYAQEFDDNIFYWNQKVNQIISSYVNPNPMIHSVSIYNYHIDRYFSTYNGIYFRDLLLEQALATFEVVPILHPITRTIESPTKTNKSAVANVLTYVMYEDTDENNRPMGAVYANLSLDYLTNSIRTASQLNDDVDTTLFVFTETNSLLLGDKNDANYPSLVAYLETNPLEDEHSLTTSAIMRYQGKKMVQTLIAVPTTGWNIVLLQPYSQVYADLRHIQFFIFFLTLAFLMVIGIAVFPITKRIYQPIDSIVTKLKDSNLAFSPTNMHDDISILNNAYALFIKQEDHLKKMRSNRVEDIIQSYHIKNLLCDASNLQPNQREILQSELAYTDASSGFFAVCCIKIQNIWHFKEEFSRSNRELFYYAVSNIASELVGEEFLNIPVDFPDSHIVLLLALQETQRTTLLPSFSNIASKLNNHIKKHFSMEATLSLSKITSELREITSLYEEALQNSTYMFVNPTHELLTDDMLHANRIDTRARYSLELDYELTGAIKQGNRPALERCLDTILDEITTLNHNAITASVTHLVVLITQVLSEVSAGKIRTNTPDTTIGLDDLLAVDNCILLREQINKLLATHLDSGENMTQEKHLIIVETIQQIIDDSYHDFNLSLPFLANQIKMSPGYVGKIFKSLTSISVAEYLNITRMEQAGILLELTEKSISDIMKEVGIENESQFYRLFRRQFGVTPKEYVLERSLSNEDENT